jgi:hypothetical protein
VCFTIQHPELLRLCVFITVVPNTKLFAWGEEWRTSAMRYDVLFVACAVCQRIKTFLYRLYRISRLNLACSGPSRQGPGTPRVTAGERAAEAEAEAEAEAGAEGLGGCNPVWPAWQPPSAARWPRVFRLGLRVERAPNLVCSPARCCRRWGAWSRLARRRLVLARSRAL